MAVRPQSRRVSKSSIRTEPLEPRRLFSVSFTHVGSYKDLYVTKTTAGDLNGDGKADVVAIGYDSGSSTQPPLVAVYPNAGAGKLGTAVMLPFTGSSADAVAIGDYNGDGIPDVAVASQGSESVSVWLGASTNVGGAAPTFGAEVITYLGSSTLTGRGSTTQFLQTGHFGGTSDDLIFGDGGPGAVLISTGGGHFAAPQYATGSDLSFLHSTTADFNGDGITDIAYETVQSDNSGIASVRFGQAGGTFGTVAQYPFGTQARSIGFAAATLVPGGKPDLVITYLNGDATNSSSTNGAVGVLLNKGDGTFGADVEQPVGEVGSDTIIGDFNGDGFPDVATSVSAGYIGLGILLGDGTGKLGAITKQAFTSQTLRATAVDLNGDGKADLVTPEHDDFGGYMSTYVEGAGSSSPSPTPTPTPTGTATVAIGITKSTLPTAFVGGAKLKGAVTVTLTNNGSAAVKETDTVTLYASTTGAIDSSSIVIGTAKHGGSLKVGVAVPVTLRAKPVLLSAGNYTVLAQATGTAIGTVATTTGPAIAVATPVTDVTPTITAITPASVVAGKSLTVTVTLSNGGNVNTTGKAVIALYLSLDGTTLNLPIVPTTTRGITVKAAGKPVTLKLKLKVPVGTSGSYVPVVTYTQNGKTTSAAATSAVSIT